MYFTISGGRLQAGSGQCGYGGIGSGVYDWRVETPVFKVDGKLNFSDFQIFRRRVKF
jgi:hypothetical protein